MANMVHGHEVMRMMVERDAPFTRDALREAMRARFGADARYHTCSAVDMTADELIDFLAARGKFRDVEGGFRTDPGRICSH